MGMLRTLTGMMRLHRMNAAVIAGVLLTTSCVASPGEVPVIPAPVVEVKPAQAAPSAYWEQATRIAAEVSRFSAARPNIPAFGVSPIDPSSLRVLEYKRQHYEFEQRLQRDEIPAIYSPTFISAALADDVLQAEDLMIGLAIDGDARAYSVAHLSDYEIVNDVVGGKSVAVTW